MKYFGFLISTIWLLLHSSTALSQAAVPPFPQELQPTGTDFNLLRFDQMRKECEDKYPSVMTLIYTEVSKSSRKRTERLPLVLGSHPGVVFAGQAGKPPKFFLDLTAIAKAAQDPGNGKSPKPPWATTRCMILAHEFWEYGVHFHAAGVGLENVIRSLNNQPTRGKTCGPMRPLLPLTAEANFVELWYHTEVLWLTKDGQLSRIEHKPDALLDDDSKFKCPPS